MAAEVGQSLTDDKLPTATETPAKPLELWAQRLRGIVEPASSNVVQLTAARA
jgi:hypothetical protein